MDGSYWNPRTKLRFWTSGSSQHSVKGLATPGISSRQSFRWLRAAAPKWTSPSCKRWSKNKMAAWNPNKPTRPHGIIPQDIKELQLVNSLTDDYHPILTSNRSCSIKLEGCPCCISLQEGRALWSIQLQAYFPWQAYLQGSWAHHCQWHHEPPRG